MRDCKLMHLDKNDAKVESFEKPFRDWHLKSIKTTRQQKHNKITTDKKHMFLSHFDI